MVFLLSSFYTPHSPDSLDYSLFPGSNPSGSLSKNSMKASAPSSRTGWLSEQPKEFANLNTTPSQSFFDQQIEHMPRKNKSKATHGPNQSRVLPSDRIFLRDSSDLSQSEKTFFIFSLLPLNVQTPLFFPLRKWRCLLFPLKSSFPFDERRTRQ